MTKSTPRKEYSDPALAPEKKIGFLAVLAETCNVGKACKAVSISRVTAYDWRELDKQFADDWARALKIGVTALEDEAHRRAFDGMDEALTHQGQLTYEVDWETINPETGKPFEWDKIDPATGFRPQPPIKRDHEGKPIPTTVKKYSDTLAIFLLKAHDPDKYRENHKIDLNAKVAIGDMSEEEIRAELAALATAGFVPLLDDSCDDLV